MLGHVRKGKMARLAVHRMGMHVNAINHMVKGDRVHVYVHICALNQLTREDLWCKATEEQTSFVQCASY